ncbi:MAG: hypothetical protein RBR78_09730 [Flavobacteriaceae bacterium]|jgi:opacity protein-like surface antigen|nr:hypothetical protein [Flavobacteriaceae bacterium]
MKKTVIILLTVLSSFLALAQETEDTKRKSEFGINFGGKLGFGTLVQSDMVNLQGSANGGDMVYYYQFPKGTSVSLGVGAMQFKANGVTAGESYSLDQMYLRIPLYINYSLSVFGEELDYKLKTYAGIGLYANTLLKEEIQTLGGTHKNKNQGWNGGYGFQLGLKFAVAKDFDFGIGFETQQDFSNMKKNGVKRKLEGVSTVNFTLGMKF